MIENYDTERRGEAKIVTAEVAIAVMADHHREDLCILMTIGRTTNKPIAIL
jgi:hypothetical protein